MKKMRMLALFLAVLMIPFSLLVSCNKKDEEEDPCAESGHQWNKKEVVLEQRTCTEPGLKERTCRICKKTETFAWKPSGHTIEKAEWVYLEDATCTEDGHEMRTCAFCDFSETRVKPGTVLNHSFKNYVLCEDGYSETSTCDRCSKATHTRIVGINIDFEGEKNTLSYEAFMAYTPEGVTDCYKTEQEGETFNSYLRIERGDGVYIGDSGFGAIFTPGYERIKKNNYVAEFDIRISETKTKDLVLLSGKKDIATVDFLSYDCVDKAISTVSGPVYYLKEADFDRWLKISVVLNDIERKYEFYIDNKLVISDVDYNNVDYFVGADLESFKVAMTHKVEEASEFDIDNIDVYIANSPKGYTDEALDPEYAVFTTSGGDKIMYKKLLDTCTHNISDTFITVAATCYSDGYKYKQCSVCEGRTDFETAEAKRSHNMSNEPVDYKAPTCIEYGWKYYKCTHDGCAHMEKVIEPMVDHIIDTTHSSYINVPATCTTDGYISGVCKNCGTQTIDEKNVEHKYGHNLADIHVVKEADCEEDGYSEGRCVNPGCGITVKLNEIPAYGHVMKTEVIEKDGKQVIETFCTRCNLDKVKTSQPLSTPGEFPTAEEIKTLLGEDNFYGGVDGTQFSTGNSTSEIKFYDNGNPSTAMSKHETSGNAYFSIKHVPETKDGKVFINLRDDVKTPGASVVIELSMRLPATGNCITGFMDAAHREPSGHNRQLKIFELKEDGTIIFDPEGLKINLGKLNKETFTRLAFVIKPDTATVDVYLDGQIKAQNYLMKKGDTSYVLPASGLLYEYRFEFDSVTSGECGLDVDEIYMYRAVMPVYVTNPFVSNTLTASKMNSISAVIYNEVKFKSGSFNGTVMKNGEIVLARSTKTSGGTREQKFLYVKDGSIYAGDGTKVYTVTQDEWIKYNVVVNEVIGVYDIYINGTCVASGVECDSNYITKKYDKIVYKVIEGNEFDYEKQNSALYEGAVMPLSKIVVSKVENVIVKTEYTPMFEAVNFTNGQNVSVYYDYVDEVIIEAGSFLKLSGDNLAKKKAVSLATVGEKTVLRTTDYKTNNLKKIEFKTLTNTRLANGKTLGKYDLSGYDYLVVAINVEKTNGYNVIFKLNAENGGYYYYRYYITKTGAQEINIPLKENGAFPYFKSEGNTTGDLKDVVSLSIEFEGAVVENGIEYGAGNGNGKLMDGTTISFESIRFENNTIRHDEFLGENVDNGEFCENDQHTYTETVVAPTCKTAGYTKLVCSCGHIAVKDIKPPLKMTDLKKGEPEEVTQQTCETDGVKITQYVCELPECAENYYAITEYKPAKAHDAKEDGSEPCTGGCNLSFPVTVTP